MYARELKAQAFPAQGLGSAPEAQNLTQNGTRCAVSPELKLSTPGPPKPDSEADPLRGVV